MAQILPFKGILYSKDSVKEISQVVAPPYDVISEEKQHVLYDRHDRNVVRLILGKMHDTDTETDNRHSRAAEYFTAWQADGTLERDAVPALYLSSVTFSAHGRTATRYGLICQVTIEPFDKGVILPHEQTFSKVKSERLALLKMCKANFSQIFSIYSDRAGILDELKRSVDGRTPDIDILDDVNERHCLWKITDSTVIGSVQAKMADKCLFIADGHHRYETALNYRNFLAETDPGFGPDHPANHIMMYLTSMEDPGLTIFPTHRVLNQADPAKLATLLENASEFFDIRSIPFGNDRETAFQKFTAELDGSTERTSFGVVVKNDPSFHLFVLKPGAMDARYGDTIHRSLRGLDVTVLAHLVFVDLLGLSHDAMDQEKLITYSESSLHAADMVTDGTCDAAFILNPTKIEQVQEIAMSGLTMPRKTTYFYPKALTGLVFNTLIP
jgi:uncharacterized protein (DUF1015 family)